ncbi:MAG: YidC/Oxa1 family insertase periplasmic-domain containing protein [Bdellovibrio sp.]|nr:YidC/Oxa1 family insertase periplasmic-domain containing protein [Bdellovibrio sp.]
MNNQNESPFGNPRFLISIVVVFLFLWGWQYYVNKNYATTPATEVSTQSTESAQNIQKSKKNDSTPKGFPQQSAPETAELKISTTEEKNFSYEDENVKWQLSSSGMGLSSFELKKYFDKSKTPIVFSSVEKLFSIEVNLEKVNFLVKKVSDVEFIGTSVVGGKAITRTIKYDKSLMYFSSNTSFEPGFASISYVFSDKKHAPSSGNFLMPSFDKQDFLFREAGKISTEHISGLKDAEVFNKSAVNVSLASIGSQYFTQAVIDKSEILPAASMSVKSSLAQMHVNYDLKNSQIKNIDQIYYVGPKLGEGLQKIDPVLAEVMDYGMFGFIAKPLMSLLKLMHQLLGNWGLAIIALTLIVRLIMLPFNILSFKSARAMQKAQPHLAAIREKYKSDPMRVNKETMAVMKEHKANPLSGCLPMLIQIPVFFALWKTIGSSIEIYQQPFFGWITDLSTHDHFFVLPVLMGVTMFFQQKLTPTTMDPMQAKILNFMPILFTLFMLSLPSGLTLYNFISALFGVTQQYFLLKSADKKTA